MPNDRALGCIVLLGIILAVSFCGKEKPTPAPVDTSRIEIRPGASGSDPALDRHKSEDFAERLVRLRLRDPDSAEFRHAENKCGYVNANNGFGGKTGFQGFVITPTMRIVLEEDDRAKFPSIWNKYCLTNSRNE